MVGVILVASFVGFCGVFVAFEISLWRASQKYRVLTNHSKQRVFRDPWTTELGQGRDFYGVRDDCYQKERYVI